VASTLAGGSPGARAHPPAAGAALDRLERVVEEQHASRPLQLGRERETEGVGVDDARPRREQAGHGAHARLAPLHLGPVHQREAGRAVPGASPRELLEHADLGVLRGHDELAEGAVGDALAHAARVQALPTLHAEARLPRAGRVVDARMDHAAVPARRLAGDTAVALEHDHAPAGSRQGGTAGEADHARAHHDDVDVGAHEFGRSSEKKP
jgi:hypothetical protein